MRCKTTRLRERGSVLVYTMILVIVAVFLALSFLGSREEWLRGQNRRLIRTFFELDSDIQLNQLRNYIQNQLASTSSLDPSGIVGSNGPLANNLQSGLTFNGTPVDLYNYAAAASASPPGVISVSPLTTPNTSLKPLTYPATSLFDPLYGASALSSTVTITQSANAVSLAETEYSNRQRVTSVGIRQVPLSNFTFFFNTSTTIGTSNFPNGVGRAHVEGDATIAGDVKAIYPFTATRRLKIPSGATLTAQRTPTDSSYTADGATTVNDLKGRFENTIVDQDVNNTHQVIPPDLIQSLFVQCQIKIDLGEGPTLPSVTPQKDTTPATAAIVLSNLTPIDPTSSLATSFPGKRIIQLDFSNPAPGVTSFYVTSSDKTAFLLIKNAGVLNQDLSIVTDLAVLVSNGFNDGSGSSTIYNPTAASIVTSQKVVGVNLDAPPKPVAINALVVGGSSDPWKTVDAYLVGTMTVYGGIAAVGTAALSPAVTNPRLTIQPDLGLLNGSKIPPITPNVFDIRIMTSNESSNSP